MNRSWIYKTNEGKGIYLGFVPSRQSRAKLSGLLEQGRVSFFQKLANRLGGR